MMIVRMQVIARVLNVTLRAEVADFTLVANALPMIRRTQSQHEAHLAEAGERGVETGGPVGCTEDGVKSLRGQERIGAVLEHARHRTCRSRTATRGDTTRPGTSDVVVGRAASPVRIMGPAPA